MSFFDYIIAADAVEDIGLPEIADRIRNELAPKPVPMQWEVELDEMLDDLRHQVIKYACNGDSPIPGIHTAMFEVTTGRRGSWFIDYFDYFG